jgi:hypothetical protein
MSPASIRRLTRDSRHLCAACGTGRARYRYRGVVRADRDHNLCFRCFRAERDRQRARLLASIALQPLKMTAQPGVSRVA